MTKYINRLKVILLTVLMGIGASMPASVHAEDVFADLAGMHQVESSYVSGRFSHNQKYWFSRDRQHGMDLSRGFSALYTYQCYSEEAVKKARSILKTYLKNNPDVELMMKTSQGPQEYMIYEKFIGENKISQMVIWSSDAPNTCEIVVIDWKNGLERSDSSISGFNSLEPPAEFDTDLFWLWLNS